MENEMQDPINLNECRAPGAWIKIAGTYLMQVTDAKKTYSKVKGTPGITFTFHDDEGNQASDTFYLSEGAMWRFNLIANACGLTEEQKANFLPTMCLGKSIEIVLAPETDYPDNMKVKEYHKTEFQVVAPTSEDVPF